MPMNAYGTKQKYELQVVDNDCCLSNHVYDSCFLLDLILLREIIFVPDDNRDYCSQYLFRSF